MRDDRVRLAIARAALVDGRKVGQWEESIAAAVQGVPALNPVELRARAQSAEIAARARASTEEFHSLKVSQRPTFVLESEIGDRAVFSGLATAAPLVAAIDALLYDEVGYASFAAHFGGAPRHPQ